MTSFTHGEARSELRESILETARWRRDKAVEFPNDMRNLEAAELLETMADTVDAVPDTLIQSYGEAFDEPLCASTCEAQSRLLREIGFASAADNAAKLIEWLLDCVADARTYAEEA